MMLKLDRDYLSAEAAALDSLLATMPANDFLGRIGIESRREEVQEELDRLGHVEERGAKVALYFGGEPVAGSMGILASFGTKAVSSFQDLMTKVWGSMEAGELPASLAASLPASLPARGRVPDGAAAQMHITSLVHGSFGFLLEELDEAGEPLFVTPLRKAADQVAEYLEVFAGENEASFSETMEELNPRVFQALRDFFGSVYRGKATFRLVEGERDDKFDTAAVERAWRRAEASNVDEDRIEVNGRLLGVIPMRRRFEFEPDGGASILEGKVGEKFSQGYLERINTEQIAGRRWKALLERKLVTKAGRPPVEKVTLLELDEIGDN